MLKQIWTSFFIVAEELCELLKCAYLYSLATKNICDSTKLSHFKVEKLLQVQQICNYVVESIIIILQHNADCVKLTYVLLFINMALQINDRCFRNTITRVLIF